MTAADNDGIVQRIFDAFARKDGFALRGLFADDAVWRVPGDSVMAGTYEGRDAIFAFLGRLPKETGGTYTSRLIDVLASDERAAALYRASGERHGVRLDLDQLLLFTFREDRVQTVLALPTDLAAFETFWARGGQLPNLEAPA